jgi:hypothetical protein
MPSKHYRWQLAWSRAPDGSLLHSTGLRVTVPALRPDTATIATFQASERARGVPDHDFAARLQRLTMEAIQWHRLHP